MKDVQFPQMRVRLIQELFDLQDIEHQEKEWFSNEYKYNFDFEFAFVIETFEDLQIFDVIDKGTDITEDIGLFYKTKKEPEAAVKVASIIRAILKELDCARNKATNEQYRNSKYLTLLRESAKEAYDIFMENEKDNKEFLDFIEKAKELREKID